MAVQGYPKKRNLNFSNDLQFSIAVNGKGLVENLLCAIGNVRPRKFMVNVATDQIAVIIRANPPLALYRSSFMLTSFA